MSPIAEILAETMLSEETFADVLSEIYTARYTGTVVVHCAGGCPVSVEFPSRQVRLVSRNLTTAAKPCILPNSK